MSTRKFSQFTNGNQVQVGDQVVGLRNGLNYRFSFPDTGFKDANGNYMVQYAGVSPSAVNSIKFISSETGQPVVLTVTGSDTNIGLNVILKNAGFFSINGSTGINAIINDSTMTSASATNISTSLAIRNYIEATAQRFKFLNPTKVATTANFNSTYDNGTSGVGATLTASSNGAASIDGVTLALSDRVLFKNQTNTFENGIYDVSQVGDGSTPAIYTRATDFDEPSEMDAGEIATVTEGTVNAGTGWLLTSSVTTIGTDPIVFIDFIPDINNVVTLNGTQTITGEKTFTATDTTIANFRFNGNTITSINTNGDITITPDGTGVFKIGKNLDLNGNALTSPDGTDSIEIPNGTVNIKTNSSSRLDITDSGVRLGGANARVTTILTDNSMSGASDTNLYTGLAIKDYIDSLLSGTPTQQIFTSGSGTYTTPANVKYIKVQMVGGGGGGGGSGTAGGGNGTAGASSTFGSSLLTAGGGGAGGFNSDGGAGGSVTVTAPAFGSSFAGTRGFSGTGTNSGAIVRVKGGAGASSFFGGAGAPTQAGAGGAAATNTGAGGAGGSMTNVASTLSFSGSGGGSGGYIEAFIDSPSATYSYAVGANGAGGAAGTSGTVGGIGAGGIIIVTEYY